jgi:outer membrane protein assembly factor BamB
MDLMSGERRFEVHNFWVQDTLLKPNSAYRKINRMTPLIYKGENLIVGNSFDSLVSYNLKTKNENWRVPIQFGVEASATLINDRLFVGSNSGKMYSIDLSNGEIVWEFDTKSELVAEPLLDDGVLYFVSGAQTLYALDASTGKQLWLYNRQDTSSSMTIRGGSKPAISEGILYVGFSDGALLALNAKTGSQQWEITLNRNTRFRDIDSSPVISGDDIFINSYDDKIYCLSKSKGEIIWSAAFGGISTPLVAGDRLYVTSSSGEIAALAKKDGKKLWSRKTEKGIMTDPEAYQDLIVTGESQGKLLFLSQDDGHIVGSFEPGRGVFSRPAQLAGSFYFISGEANVYGVSAEYTNNVYFNFLRR